MVVHTLHSPTLAHPRYPEVFLCNWCKVMPYSTNTSQYGPFYAIGFSQTRSPVWDSALQALIGASNNYCHLSEKVNIIAHGFLLAMSDSSKHDHDGWLPLLGSKNGLWKLCISQTKNLYFCLKWTCYRLGMIRLELVKKSCISHLYWHDSYRVGHLHDLRVHLDLQFQYNYGVSKVSLVTLGFVMIWADNGFFFCGYRREHLIHTFPSSSDEELLEDYGYRSLLWDQGREYDSHVVDGLETSRTLLDPF